MWIIENKGPILATMTGTLSSYFAIKFSELATPWWIKNTHVVKSFARG